MTGSPRRSRRWTTAVAIAPLSALALGGVAATAAPAPAQAPAVSAAVTTPNIAKLAGPLAKQKLTWAACDYQDPSLNQRFGSVANVKCATVKVPKDWTDPGNGETWNIKVSQATNQKVDSGRYKGTIFVNPGGPGGSGLAWAAAMQQRTPDLRPYYNYVGFDPRGVGQSGAPRCAFTWDRNSTDPYAYMKAVGEQCATDPEVKTINTEQTVYDMDLIRHLLKAPKLDYIGYSYGTWLGAWYEKTFPAKAGRFLLDSATDVTEPTLQRTWDFQNIARDRQFETHMMNWIARHDAEYQLGTDPKAIHSRYLAATKNIDPFIVLLFWYLGGGLQSFPNNELYPYAASTMVELISLGEDGPGEVEELTSLEPAAAAEKLLRELRANPAVTADQRSIIDEGLEVTATLTSLDAAPALSTQQRQAADPDPVTQLYQDTFDMIRCGDGQWTQGEKYWENWATKNAKKGPFSASLGLASVPQCAFWQTNNLMPVADEDSFPNTVLLQGELDSQTAWEAGRRSGVQLPNTSAIFVDNEGSHGLFPYGTECVDRPIYNYFLNGRQPKDIKVCQALPLIGESQTYESWGKLNNKGKHVPVDPGPYTPAGRVAATAPTLELTPDSGAEESQVRELIAQTYGQEGVDALPGTE